MIKLQDLTPSVYYEKSRDFQFIGRLYDIVLNHLKTNADSLYNLPVGKNMNERLLNLLALTLGFQTKHHYNAIQLNAICSVLPLILKNKGSLNAIIIAVNALLYAEGIKQPLDYSIKSREGITLYLPEQLADLSLLTDLLVYILPAGLSCRLVKEISEQHTIITELTTNDEVTVYGDPYTTNPATLGQMLRVKDEAEQDKLMRGAAGVNSGMLANTTILKGTLNNHYQEIKITGTTDSERTNSFNEARRKYMHIYVKYVDGQTASFSEITAYSSNFDKFYIQELVNMDNLEHINSGNEDQTTEESTQNSGSNN